MFPREGSEDSIAWPFPHTPQGSQTSESGMGSKDSVVWPFPHTPQGSQTSESGLGNVSNGRQTRASQSNGSQNSANHMIPPTNQHSEHNQRDSGSTAWPFPLTGGK